MTTDVTIYMYRTRPTQDSYHFIQQIIKYLHIDEIL